MQTLRTRAGITRGESMKNFLKFLRHVLYAMLLAPDPVDPRKHRKVA